MVRYREILMLTAKGLSQRTVAASVGCARSTVSEVVARCASAGIAWPLPEEMNDAAIRARICPSRTGGDAGWAPIDHERVERELGRRGVTMALLCKSESAPDPLTQGLPFRTSCRNGTRCADGSGADSTESGQIQIQDLGGVNVRRLLSEGARA